MHRNTVFVILALCLVVGAFVFFGDSKKVPSGPQTIATMEVELSDGATYELVADEVIKLLDGKPVAMLAYNGMIPGPTIKVKEGATITVRFTNRTTMPTLLHSHGVRMENPYDGTHLVQKNIEPGESFDYKLRFDDPGVFWYHPHVREDIQQNMGLYGNFVVAPKTADFWPPADHTETIFLSDVLIEGGRVAAYSDDYITHALMGRFGNTLLINGDTDYTSSGEPGEVHRMYVTNSATVRPFNFRIGGGAKMKLIGGDNGRYEREEFVDSVMLSPSERAVIDVYFPEAGTYVLEHAIPGGKTYMLGKKNITGARVDSASRDFATLRTHADVVREFDTLRTLLPLVPQKTLRLTVAMDMPAIMGQMGGGMAGHDHGAMGGNQDGGGMGMMHSAVPIEWEDTMGDMNTFSTSETVTWVMRDEETGKENMDINWLFSRGPHVKIRIINDATSMHPMQHPIHFHGNRFAVLSVNDVPNTNMVWKDTALLKTGDVVDIVLETTNPGKWMAHCHIAEHMHSGMMIGYTVE